MSNPATACHTNRHSHPTLPLPLVVRYAIVAVLGLAFIAPSASPQCPVDAVYGSFYTSGVIAVVTSSPAYHPNPDELYDFIGPGEHEHDK